MGIAGGNPLFIMTAAAVFGAVKYPHEPGREGRTIPAIVDIDAFDGTN